MTKIGNIVEGRLEELHERYYVRLLPIAKKLCRGAPGQGFDPHDLVQETFLRYLDHFGTAHPEHDAEPADGWLVRVMTRHFIDQLRRATSRQKATDDPTITRWTMAQDESLSTYERLGQARFDWAIAQLPEQQRITYLLCSKNLSNPQIARELGASVTTVAKRLFDARANLRKLLQPYVEEGIQ